MKPKPKPKKTRNFHAANAHGRVSQGPMKDRKKDQNKKKCRKSKQKKREE